MILPPLPPNKTKKKDKPATGKPATRIARPRKNIVFSDSETDDEKMPDAAAEIEKLKTQNMSMRIDHAAASSNDEKSREVHTAITNDAPDALTGLQYSEDVLRAADLLLGFFHAADTPTSASSTTSCSTNSGLAAVLDATGSIDRRPDLFSRQQKPSASLTSDPAARLHELNKHYSRDDHPPWVPEKGHDDFVMYDHSSASSFTPINARKEIIIPRVLSLLPSLKSLRSLAKARKETRKSPSDRFIHSRRPERPREATNDDRVAHGVKIPDNWYEESDSDVEIVGARKLRHDEPPFGNGNGNTNNSEFKITDFSMLNKANSIQSNIKAGHKFTRPRVYSKKGAAGFSDQYPTAPVERPSGGRESISEN